MRIEAVCNTCGRAFLLAQLLPEPEGGTAGRCPFCGTRYGRHYLALLPETIRTAEAAADAFIAALQRLIDANPGFRVDVAGLMRRLESEVSRAIQYESA